MAKDEEHLIDTLRLRPPTLSFARQRWAVTRPGSPGHTRLFQDWERQLQLGRQDKRALLRERANGAASAARENSARARRSTGGAPVAVSPAGSRVRKRSTQRQTVPITVWMRQPAASELKRLAEQEGLSVSATAAALLDSALRQQLHHQHAALLQPLVEQAIRDQVQRMSQRLAGLLIQVLLDTGQSRRLLVNVLGRQPGIDAEMLTHILDESAEGTRRALGRRTPQTNALIEQELARWLEEKGTHG